MNNSSPSGSSFFTPSIVGTAVGVLACIPSLVPGITLLSFVPSSAFAPLGAGLAAGVLAAFILFILKRLTGAEAVSSVMAFFVPVALAVIAASAVHALLPGSRAGADLVASVGMLTMIFCAIGIIYSMWTASRESKERWTRLVLPPVIAVFLVSAYAAWTIVSSVAYQYRDAVDFRVEKMDFRKPGLAVEATIYLLKAGDYEFEGIGEYNLANTDGNSARLEWAAKKSPKEPGIYPVKLIWDRGWVKGKVDQVEEGAGFEGNQPLLQVRLANTGATLRYFPIVRDPGQSE